MTTSTFSATEFSSKFSEGWLLVKENVIGGKIRTVVMSKEGSKFAYIDGETAVKEAHINSLNKADKKRYFNHAALYARGLDV